MKNFKYLLLLLSVLFIMGCNKDEVLNDIEKPKKEEITEKPKEDEGTDKDDDDTAAGDDDTTGGEDNGDENNEGDDKDGDKDSGEGNTDGEGGNESMVTITFDIGGGNTPEPMKVNKGAKFIALPQPKRSNQEFMGWAREKDGIVEVLPGATLPEVQEDIILYAKWRVVDSGVSNKFKNKSQWVYGVKAPEFPVGEDESKIVKGNVEGQWTKDDFGLIEIRWKKGAGWYDINKAKPNDRYSDNHLCWAAASSNMIHWWIEHNKDYIKKYNEIYPEEPKIPEIDYDIPENYSEIFDLFTKTYVDKGSWTLGGINWFFTGKRVELPASRNFEENKKFNGYFSKVFGNDIIKSLTERYSWPNKERFNRIIKDALENNRGLSFDVHISGYGNHAMTIWGAEFDANGDVSYIYYCDNNSSEEVNTKGICVRRKIIYEGNKTYYVPRDNEKHKNQIITIYSLDLGKDIWERSLSK